MEQIKKSENYYEKIPFVWEQPKPLIKVSRRLEFRSLNSVGIAAFTNTVSQVIASSLDRRDRKEVKELGIDRAANKYITEVSNDFDYQPKWWQLGFNNEGKLVGFLQPVIYRGCSKNSLEEGTIYYIGVVPEYRGKHYIYDLLCQATRILQEVGVWRVFCDTDVHNKPMINAFQEVGYRQFSSPRKLPL
ncbi:GNAT family N-acetyltransferase [Pleurocapsa sp. PCC 7319]|uniref:GNAT family N-acetyltransferase n=1 Tax=Pleurocapsa sp. PCC 7319 TaxID=118161 RepID=UPI000372F3BF|nr:GNAT family N-acetyltransferase [Pleurocapsa sp. PCC 7319]